MQRLSDEHYVKPLPGDKTPIGYSADVVARLTTAGIDPADVPKLMKSPKKLASFINIMNEYVTFRISPEEYEFKNMHGNFSTLAYGHPSLLRILDPTYLVLDWSATVFAAAPPLLAAWGRPVERLHQGRLSR